MTTQNSVDVGLSGNSGTGSFVGNNSPTLVSPSLGVAAATSINFGGSSLALYTDTTSFSPVFTFVTPGDLSVAYSTQVGEYLQIGALVFVGVNLVFTPTYTTASGNVRISMPVAMISSPTSLGQIFVSTIVYPAGTTSLNFLTTAANQALNIQAQGSTVTAATLSVTQFLTGVQYTIAGSICYLSTN
jgi:hypothetical protein